MHSEYQKSKSALTLVEHVTGNGLNHCKWVLEV